MVKRKISLEDALSNIENAIAPIHNNVTKPKELLSVPKEQKAVDKAIKIHTKKLIIEINEETHYQIHQLRLDLRKSSIKDLVTEALNDLFKKYGKPPIA